MDIVGGTSTGPKQVKSICIREYAKRTTFLPIFFPEYNCQAKINASLLLENNVALVNNPENTETPNSSDVGSGGAQAARLETLTEHIIGNYENLETVSDRDAVNNINNDKNSNFEETMATRNNSNTQHRNLGRKKPQRYRLLSNIYKGIEGSFTVATSENSDNEFSIDPEHDSDDDTLITFIKKVKAVRLNSKNHGQQAVKPNLVGAKRAKHRKDAQLVQPTNILEISSLSDTEIMAALQLVELSKAGVNTKMSSNTATKYPTLCVVNRNPSEFSTVDAKLFMRCG